MRNSVLIQLRLIGDDNYNNEIDIQYLDLSFPPDFLAFLTLDDYEIDFDAIWDVFKPCARSGDQHKYTGVALENLILEQKGKISNEEIGGIFICFKNLGSIIKNS